MLNYKHAGNLKSCIQFIPKQNLKFFIFTDLLDPMCKIKDINFINFLKTFKYCLNFLTIEIQRNTEYLHEHGTHKIHINNEQKT